MTNKSLLDTAKKAVLYWDSSLYSLPEFEEAIAELRTACENPQPALPPQISFQVESAAFESWAADQNMDMQQHPLHYLFLDPHTYAARQVWKAAIAFMEQRRSPVSLVACVEAIEDCISTVNCKTEDWTKAVLNTAGVKYE